MLMVDSAYEMPSCMQMMDPEDHPVSQINSIISRMREKSNELIRHEHTLKNSSYAYGKSKSSLETQILQNRDRALDGTNFQDLAIRRRTVLKPREYANKKEFLNEDETSDEEAQKESPGGVVGESTLRQVLKQRENLTTAATSTKTKSQVGHARAQEARSSLSVQKPEGPKYTNFEAKDLVCQLESMNLPVQEQPDIMKNYMHKRIAQQANNSLNTRSVMNVLEKEVSKQRIAKLRLYYHKLIGVRRFNKH